MSKEIKKPSAATNELFRLLAIGVAGGWVIELLESASTTAEEWSVTIEGPSVYLGFPVNSPNVLKEMLALLAERGEADHRNSELLLGTNRNESATLLRDDEVDDRFFLLVRSLKMVVRITFVGDALNSLERAVKQVCEDLVEAD